MSSEHSSPSVEALACLDLEGLRAAWRTGHGPPPPLRSPELLRLILAWRIQAGEGGGLDPETRKALARKGPVRSEGLDLGIGARLTRTWKGHRVEVTVEDEGFCWEGQRFASLSSVASAIAGTRWNGPRFFGLREERS